MSKSVFARIRHRQRSIMRHFMSGYSPLMSRKKVKRLHRLSRNFDESIYRHGLMAYRNYMKNRSKR